MNLVPVLLLSLLLEKVVQSVIPMITDRKSLMCRCVEFLSDCSLKVILLMTLVIFASIELYIIALSDGPSHLLDSFKVQQMKSVAKCLLPCAIKQVQRLPIRGHSKLTQHG